MGVKSRVGATPIPSIKSMTQDNKIHCDCGCSLHYIGCAELLDCTGEGMDMPYCERWECTACHKKFENKFDGHGLVEVLDWT